MKEEWRTIPDLRLQGRYEVSNYGNVRRKDTVSKTANRFGPCTVRNKSKPIVQKKTERTGYWRVSISVDGKKICFSTHRAVCSAFHAEVEGKNIVRHLDGNKDNNRANNLCWGTHAENTADALKVHKTLPTGERCKQAKLNAVQAKEIFIRRQMGETLISIAKDYKIDKSMVSLIHKRVKWVDVTSVLTKWLPA